ncbi:MAG: hypothetical protein RLN69_10210, partial [Woeseiaceae bacterium]
LLRGLRDRGLSREHQQQVNDAMDLMSDAQDRLQALQAELIETRERNHQLQRQIDDEITWQKRRALYFMVATPGGAHVFREGADGNLYVCPACIENRQIMLLQNLGLVSGDWHCPGCKQNYPIDERQRY